MIVPYKPIMIRHTQAGWVLDAYLVKQAILPVSIIINVAELYKEGFCYNSKRTQIKKMFECALSEEYNKEFIQ